MILVKVCGVISGVGLIITRRINWVSEAWGTLDGTGIKDMRAITKWLFS